MAKKILIIRMSSIGDIVLTTALIRCLKKQIPQVHLDYLCKEKYGEILKYNPYLNRLYHYPKKKKSQRLLRAILKKNEYDWVIDLQNNPASHYLCSMIRRSNTQISRLEKYRWQRWLYCKLKIGKYSSQVHMVEKTFLAVKTYKRRRVVNSAHVSSPVAHQQIRIENDGQGLDFFFPKQLTQQDADLLKAGLPQTEYVALVIGATYQTKKLPLEKLSALVHQLSPILPLVIVGGKSEEEVAQKITMDMAATKQAQQPINFCNRLSLFGSAWVLKRSQVVISYDTGLMHIAAALKKNVITIWGNTSPLFGMWPYYGQNFIEHFSKNVVGGSKQIKQTSPFQVIQVEGLACRPCSHLGYARCPKKHFRCMRLIQIEQIVRQAKGYLTCF